MKRIVHLAALALLIFAAGCPATSTPPTPPEDAEPAPPPEPPEPPAPEMSLRWAPGVLPVDVLASGNLSDCQFEAVELGVDEWEAAVGADLFTVRRVAEDHPAFSGAPPLHTVPTSSAELEPGTVGLATIMHTRDDIIQAVRVQLDEPNGCNRVERVASHELGHVLGLQHASHPDCLLYMSVVDGPWDIHDYEIEWVRNQVGSQ